MTLLSQRGSADFLSAPLTDIELGQACADENFDNDMQRFLADKKEEGVHYVTSPPNIGGRSRLICLDCLKCLLALHPIQASSNLHANTGLILRKERA